jgi:hypothetical protein
MPKLGRNWWHREVADFITATVALVEEGWLVRWWGEGALPRQLTASSLTEAAGQAASAAAVLYAGSPPIPGARLQLAIYPWEYSVGEPIFDISGDLGHFIARDIQGSEAIVEGATLEDLVTAVQQMLDGDVSMFRWIRPVAALPLRVSAEQPAKPVTRMFAGRRFLGARFASPDFGCSAHVCASPSRECSRP